MGPPAPSGIGATGGIIAFPYTEKGIPLKKEKTKIMHIVISSSHCLFSQIKSVALKMRLHFILKKYVTEVI